MVLLPKIKNAQVVAILKALCMKRDASIAKVVDIQSADKIHD
jgi:hypothetical protein